METASCREMLPAAVSRLISSCSSVRMGTLRSCIRLKSMCHASSPGYQGIGYGALHVLPAQTNATLNLKSSMESIGSKESRLGLCPSLGMTVSSLEWLQEAPSITIFPSSNFEKKSFCRRSLSCSENLPEPLMRKAMGRGSRRVCMNSSHSSAGQTFCSL